MTCTISRRYQQSQPHKRYIPNLIQHRTSVVGRVFASSSLVVSGTSTTQVWHGTILMAKRTLHVTQSVARGVGWVDIVGAEPTPCRESHVVLDRSLEKIHHVLVLTIFWPVAGNVESTVACRVLAEFMAPEVVVGAALVDPVLVHVGEEIVLAECLDESANVRTGVGRHNGAIGQTGGGVWAWLRVVLSLKIAVLRIGT